MTYVIVILSDFSADLSLEFYVFLFSKVRILKLV